MSSYFPLLFFLKKKNINATTFIPTRALPSSTVALTFASKVSANQRTFESRCAVMMVFLPDVVTMWMVNENINPTMF